MWEIIAQPDDYGIEILEEGINNSKIPFEKEDREKWAEEIGTFTSRINGLADRAEKMQQLFRSEDQIVATPASIKALKVQFFKINDAFEQAMSLANGLEEQIVKK